MPEQNPKPTQLPADRPDRDRDEDKDRGRPGRPGDRPDNTLPEQPKPEQKPA